MCEMVFCKNDCHLCFSLCPRRPGSFALLKKNGSGKIELLTNERYELPYHIVVLPDRLTEELHVNNIIGVHGGNMMSSNGEMVAKCYYDRGLQGALNTANDIEGVLQFYVKDRTLEGFWDNRKEIYRQLRSFNWKIIIAPNFSVYEDAPRIDHLYNIQRSSIVYNELIERGFPAIPDVAWYNQIDLDQYILQINEKNIKTIAFSFQVVDTKLRASNLWKHYLLGFTYLCNRIPDDVQIVLTGIVSEKKLVAAKKAAGNKKIAILNQSAFLYSRRGVLAETRKKASIKFSKNDLLLKNIEYFNKKYREINESEDE